MDEHQAHLLISNGEHLQLVTQVLSAHRVSTNQLIHQTLDQFFQAHKAGVRKKQILCTDNPQLPGALHHRGLFIPIVVIGNENHPMNSMSCLSAINTEESLNDKLGSVLRIADQLQKLKNSARKLATLADRERRIIDLAAEGIPNKAIATQLGVSIKTVEKNRRNAYHKLSVTSTAEMASLVTFNRYIDPNLGSSSVYGTS